MKVLLISPLPPPAGGIASWTRRYLESRKAKENEVDVVNIAVTGKRVENFTTKNSIFAEIKRNEDIMWDLENKLRKKKYDIVHLNSSCSKFGLLRDYLVCLKVKKYGVRLLVQMHCDVTYMLSGVIAEKLFKKVVRLSDCVLTLNRVSDEYIRKNCQKDTIIVPNFVSDEYVAHLNESKIISDKIKTALFVGHILRTKGCDLICNIASDFPDINFRLVGHVSEEIRKLPKPSNVTLVDEMPLEKILEEYKVADIFVFPTHTEGFPNVVSEAMSAGLPIIATRVGAIPDMLEDKGGLFVPIDGEKELKAAITALSDPEIRRKMSRFNRDKVMREYTINNVMDRLFKIYEGIRG